MTPMLPKVILEGWMLDRKQVEQLAIHLENRGWKLDARGDMDCFDQGAALCSQHPMPMNWGSDPEIVAKVKHAEERIEEAFRPLVFGVNKRF